MRVIVTGSRDWKATSPVLDALNRRARRHGVELVIANHPDGAERIARDWCLNIGGEMHVYSVHNNRRSNKTNELRDARIVRDGADLCLCFCIVGDEISDVARMALDAGIGLLVFKEGEGWQETHVNPRLSHQ